MPAPELALPGTPSPASPASRSGPPTAPPPAGAAYVLSLESVAGAIRVADVQVTSSASASGEASCVVSALQGQPLHAPSAEPGTRWSMPFAVRAGPVATSR